MTLSTSARDEALLEEIANLFEIYASDSDDFARRGFGSKRINEARAQVWREAAADVRSIKLVR